MPKPSTSMPGAAGAAWHREHVGQRVVGGQFGGRHAAGERHVVGHPAVLGQLAQRLQVGTAADDHQRGAVDAPPDRRQRLDQHVLAFARHQPRQAHHGGPLAQPVAVTQLGAAGRIGPEPVGVHPGRQVLQRGRGPEGRREPRPRVAADEGHDVGVVADAAQHRPRDRKHRPAHFVAVRAGQHPRRAGLPGTLRQQGQRCGRAEPDGVDAVVGDQPAHPGIDRRAGQHQRAGMAHHPIAGRIGLSRQRRRRPSIAARTPSPHATRRRPADRRTRPGRTGCRRAAAESRWLPAGPGSPASG